MAHSSRNLYYLLFSVLALSSETCGCAIICINCVLYCLSEKFLLSGQTKTEGENCVLRKIFIYIYKRRSKILVYKSEGQVFQHALNTNVVNATPGGWAKQHFIDQWPLHHWGLEPYWRCISWNICLKNVTWMQACDSFKEINIWEGSNTHNFLCSLTHLQVSYLVPW